MTSLSKALSDMSASMSHEELAQFIISLSNKKMELQKQYGWEKSPRLSLLDEFYFLIVFFSNSIHNVHAAINVCSRIRLVVFEKNKKTHPLIPKNDVTEPMARLL